MEHKLVLLVGANPRVCKAGPRVMLKKGQWRISCVGLVDSELVLHNSLHIVRLDLSSTQKIGVPMSIGGIVQVFVNKVGTENKIQVEAELIE